MIANCLSGWSAATALMASAWAKPTASTTVAPRRTIRRMACSRWASLVTWNSSTSTPVSSTNFRTPFQMPSLKLLSNFPPLSKTTAGLKSAAQDTEEIRIAVAATTRILVMSLSLSKLLGLPQPFRLHGFLPARLGEHVRRAQHVNQDRLVLAQP